MTHLESYHHTLPSKLVPREDENLNLKGGGNIVAIVLA